MSTNADDPRIPAVAPGDATDDEPAVPPVLSGKSMLRKGFLRWLLTGSIRLLYRFWTRIAVRVFPEDSRRAALATRIGIPLPDQLNMSWITPHLAVGGRVLPADIPRLARTGITRVVDTRSEHKDDADALGREGIKLLYLPTPDTQPLTIAQLQEGARWINQQIAAGERVLVHCEHGVGRSVLLTAAALVAGGMSAHNAIELVQRKRWQAAPNHHQMRRLQEFERAVHLAQLPTGA
ncbi:MAG TPA: dual specificity protein phosphatase [Ktedonobacterales bacterium]|nr:dual specificity protein phosphatase [Ktedonobacterales bacterium]